MINRILIRIKVLQIVYAYHQNGNGDLKSAENDLQFSLKKSYELYLAFFLLLIEVTRLQNRILASKKEKYIPTEEELNPNMRFVNNRFIAQLAADEGFWKLIKENGISWDNDEDFVKRILDQVLNSDLYAEYLEAEEDSFEQDQQFWAKAFKQLICDNEMIDEYTGSANNFKRGLIWDDDPEIGDKISITSIVTGLRFSDIITPGKDMGNYIMIDTEFVYNKTKAASSSEGISLYENASSHIGFNSKGNMRTFNYIDKPNLILSEGQQLAELENIPAIRRRKV